LLDPAQAAVEAFFLLLGRGSGGLVAADFGQAFLSLGF
jgi:hypothetical protein